MTMSSSYEIILSSRSAISFEPMPSGIMMWTYKLSRSYTFDRQYEVKLNCVHGVRTPYILFSDIVKPSDCGDSMENVLGSTIKDSNVYKEINGSFLPSSGTILVRSLSGAPIKKPDHMTLFLHLRPVVSDSKIR